MDINPAQYPLRTLAFSFPVMLFSYFSLHFLRHVNSGSTIILKPSRFLTTFKVVSGKAELNPSQKKSGFLKSYNGPLASAFLGLFMFAAAEFLLILIFRQWEI